MESSLKKNIEKTISKKFSIQNPILINNILNIIEEIYLEENNNTYIANYQQIESIVKDFFIYNNYNQFLNFLKENHTSITESLEDIIILNLIENNINSLKQNWFDDLKFLKINYADIFTLAIIHQKINVINYLLINHIDLDPKYFNLAAEIGNIDILDLLVNFKCPFNFRILEFAFYGQNQNSVINWLKQNKILLNKNIFNKNTYDIAVRERNLDLAKWLKENIIEEEIS